MEHPTTDLIAYLHGELAAPGRQRLEAHLAVCPDCRRERDAFAVILGALRSSAPSPPEIQWERWRGELRDRLHARRTARRWWGRPVPVALAAGLGGGVLVLAWLGGERPVPRPEIAALEEVVGEGPELELLEDLDVIHQLDGLAPRRGG